MQVNILIRRPIIGSSRTLLIRDVREIIISNGVALMRCALDDTEEEVIYPINKILSISD